MIRVLIADDQEMVRAGFRLILEARDDIEVIADVANGVDAVRIARDKHPDVCLLDIRMPGIDGLEATKQLAGPGVTHPIKIVVVTTFDLDEYVSAALHNGASGFLLKDAGPALLVEAIYAAARGDALISPQITLRLLKHFRQANAPRGPSTANKDSATNNKAAQLTEKEAQVLRAVAQGLTNTETGQRLFMSVSTVKTHLAAAQGKVDARNRVEAAAWAWRSGLMDDE